jgi:hypothetical protein
MGGTAQPETDLFADLTPPSRTKRAPANDPDLFADLQSPRLTADAATQAAAKDRGQRFDKMIGTTLGGFFRGAGGFLESVGTGGEVLSRAAEYTPGVPSMGPLSRLFALLSPSVRRAGAVVRDVAGTSPVKQSFRDISDAREALDYGTAAFGNTLGSILPALATGPLAPAAFVAAGVGETRSNLERAAATSGVPLDDAKADLISLGVGAATGALDTVLPGRVSRLVGSSVG